MNQNHFDNLPYLQKNNNRTEGNQKRSLISIVIPVWNEEMVLGELYSRLRDLMDRQKDYDFEVVLVENGSHDKSFEMMVEMNRNDSRFKIVQLSRNFTADGGVAAGLRHCSGDCAILMDADLQDPPEVVDQFLQKWKDGNEIVFGVIKKREGLSATRKFANKIFYKTINFLTNGSIPENVTAFRLMDKVVYQQLNLMPERNRFTRGLCNWVGFKQVGIEFDRADRFAGESKAPFWDVLKEANYAIFSFSFLPVKFITLIGMLLSGFCFLFLVFQLGVSIIYGQDIPGYRTIIVTILLLFGFLFIALGIMGEYISLIFDEVKARPLFILKDRVGFEKNNNICIH